MFGLSLIDLVIIFAYFLMMIFIGMWAMRRVKSQEDYFLAGRRFGKLIQTFAAFGQGTSADTCVSVTTTTFTNGASGIWSSLLWIFATPFYWLVSPWMRRLRLLTLGDFFEDRYGSKPLAAVYALIGTIGTMAVLAVGFTAMTKTIVGLTPKTYEQMTTAEQTEYRMAEELARFKLADYASLSQNQKERLNELVKLKPKKIHSHLSETVLVWVVCIVVMLYAVTGGLEAAFITDMIQGIFIILLSVILLPFGWAKINSIYGGSSPLSAMGTTHQQLPDSFFEVFGSPTAIDFTWYYITALSIMSVINVVIQPNMIVATGSAKDEYAARFGFTVGNFIKRFCTVFWSIFALGAIVLYHGQVNDPDYVWGYAALDLLKPLNIGLIGLMIACLMAALMSTADCMMLTCASLLTRNLYRPLFANRSEKHYVWTGRIMGAMTLIGGAMIATQFDSLLQLLKLWWELNVIVAASFWLGMKWRRANRPAAWCSIGITALIFFILPWTLPLIPGFRTNPALQKQTHPTPIVKPYIARQMDIDMRQAAIVEWDRLDGQAQAQGPRPEPLVLGQSFDKEFLPPSKAVFWTSGIKRDYGSGSLSLELILLDKLGFDLEANPYAMNETLRITIRTITPFMIFILVILFTKPDKKEMLDRFFVKMKTPVSADREMDKKELELSLAEPRRFDHKKLFPNSSWEFYKWTKVDTVGFLFAVLGVALILGLLKLLVSIGG